MPGFYRHKVPLYFDEHFPDSIVQALRVMKRWKKRLTVLSVRDCHLTGREDREQYEYCRGKGYVLVTRDRGFLDDKRDPLNRCPGIVVLAGPPNQVRMLMALDQFLNFVCRIPFPRGFLGDSKFLLTVDACIMRGRDTKTREIKTLRIIPGRGLREIAGHFNYIWESGTASDRKPHRAG